ncbi:hypothetical protein ABEV55_18425 [Aneurinibacillus thermoaerophilus]|uniref:hypothetical protein n=1 Tax=Aneurinibacillus thermoaerophilus TaxID=143495 RepID=UPI002E232EB4|nr:hypothetical protein [Aneurinibacillus thermoaerophilus]
MKNFYMTNGGRRFIDNTVPHLIEFIERLVAELKRSNDLRERELNIAMSERKEKEAVR